MTIQRYFVLGLAWLSLAPSAFSQPAGRDPNALIRFQNSLQQDGFDVNPGAAIALNFVAAWCAGTPFPGIDGAGYSNNQQYLQLLVPKSAQKPAELTSVFQVDPAEAIVLIGLTPPPERYFGFYPFLRNKVMPNGKKKSLWTTLGDAVNNATVKTTGSTPFNSPVALIFTPDQGTDARVRKALERGGYPAAIINTVVFPASMLKLGHGDLADDLLVLLRNALWEKGAEAAGEAYIQNPPLHLFRVTPRTETIANPFPVPRLRVRGAGQTEMDLMNKLGQLRDGIIKANPGLYPRDVEMLPPETEGYYNMQRGLDPWGDSRDAFVLFAGFMPEYGLTDEITLADGEFLMIYGVNHVATGKASYHSINVYESKVGKVPVGGADDRVFSGTAMPYLPGDPAANLMYAFKVSRSCGNEPNCVTLAIDNCPRVTIGPNSVLGLAFRMYLEPATKVGAAMPEVLYDRVIKFSPRP